MRPTPGCHPSPTDTLCEQRPPHTRSPLTSIFFRHLKRTAAMLDRLLHRSVVFNIDGDSYRMRTHHARAEALRKTVAP